MSTRRAKGRRLVDCVLLENGVIFVGVTCKLPTCAGSNDNRTC